MTSYDLLIRYYPFTGTDVIQCRCTDWVVSDYSFTVETWLTKSQVDTLLSHTVPGAVDTLFTLMGRPVFYDSTWDSYNTLYFMPTGASESTLPYRRNETGMFIKNIRTHPIEGGTHWVEVKIDGYISGSNTFI